MEGVAEGGGEALPSLSSPPRDEGVPLPHAETLPAALGDALSGGVALRVGAALREPLPECEGDPVAVPLGEGVPEGGALAVAVAGTGEAVPPPRREPVLQDVAEAVATADDEARPEGEGTADSVSGALRVAAPMGVGEAGALPLPVGDPVALPALAVTEPGDGAADELRGTLLVPEADGEGEEDACAEGVGLPCGDALGDAVAIAALTEGAPREGLPAGDCEARSETLPSRPAVPVKEQLGEPLEEGVGDAVVVPLAQPLRVAAALDEGGVVPLARAVPVAARRPVSVPLLLAENEALPEKDAVIEALPLEDREPPDAPTASDRLLRGDDDADAVSEAHAEALGDAVARGEPVAGAEAVPSPPPAPPLPEGAAEALREAEAEPLPLRAAEADVLVLCAAEGDARALDEPVANTDAQTVEVVLGVGGAVALPLPVAQVVPLTLTAPLALACVLPVVEGVEVAFRDAEEPAVVLPVPLPVREPELHVVGDPVGDAVEEAVGGGVAVSSGESVVAALSLDAGLLLLLPVAAEESDADGDAEADAEPLSAPVPLKTALLESDAQTVEDAPPRSDALTLPLGGALSLGDGAPVPEPPSGDAVGVPDAHAVADVHTDAAGEDEGQGVALPLVVPPPLPSWPPTGDALPEALPESEALRTRLSLCAAEGEAHAVAPPLELTNAEGEPVPVPPTAEPEKEVLPEPHPLPLTLAVTDPEPRTPPEDALSVAAALPLDGALAEDCGEPVGDVEVEPPPPPPLPTPAPLPLPLPLKVALVEAEPDGERESAAGVAVPGAGVSVGEVEAVPEGEPPPLEGDTHCDALSVGDMVPQPLTEDDMELPPLPLGAPLELPSGVAVGGAGECECADVADAPREALAKKDPVPGPCDAEGEPEADAERVAAEDEDEQGDVPPEKLPPAPPALALPLPLAQGDALLLRATDAVALPLPLPLPSAPPRALTLALRLAAECVPPKVALGVPDAPLSVTLGELRALPLPLALPLALPLPPPPPLLLLAQALALPVVLPVRPAVVVGDGVCDTAPLPLAVPVPPVAQGVCDGDGVRESGAVPEAASEGDGVVLSEPPTREGVAEAVPVAAQLRDAAALPLPVALPEPHALPLEAPVAVPPPEGELVSEDARLGVGVGVSPPSPPPGVPVGDALPLPEALPAPGVPVGVPEEEPHVEGVPEGRVVGAAEGDAAALAAGAPEVLPLPDADAPPKSGEGEALRVTVPQGDAAGDAEGATGLAEALPVLPLGEGEDIIETLVVAQAEADAAPPPADALPLPLDVGEAPGEGDAPGERDTETCAVRVPPTTLALRGEEAVGEALAVGDSVVG